MDAARILLSFDPPAWHLTHVGAVAEVAAFIAQQTERRGIHVDRSLVEAAALLHDIDKLFPEDDPLLELGHGEAGARWLTRHGFAELARPVAAHPVTRLFDAERYGRWSGVASREERIVAYSDKRAGQQLESLAARFAGWESRYPSDTDVLRRARARGERLEREVCETAGVSPLAVHRLRWVTSALAAARRRPGDGSGAAPVDTTAVAGPAGDSSDSAFGASGVFSTDRYE